MTEKRDPRQTLSRASDDLWDWLGNASEETFERIDQYIETAVLAVCEASGHDPIPDQCGIPEHDYCMWCQTGTPNQAERPPK